MAEILRVRCDKIVTRLFIHQGRRHIGSVQLLACHGTWTVLTRNIKGCQWIRCALAAKLMSYEVDIREMEATSGKRMTFITHYSFIPVSRPLSLSSESHKNEGALLCKLSN